MSKPLHIIINDLRALQPELQRRFGVRSLAVFGSRASETETETSDLDLLVRFEEGAKPTLFSLADLDWLLEDRLGLKVDTVPETCINPRIEPYIRATLREI